MSSRPKELTRVFLAGVVGLLGEQSCAPAAEPDVIEASVTANGLTGSHSVPESQTASPQLAGRSTAPGEVTQVQYPGADYGRNPGYGQSSGSGSGQRPGNDYAPPTGYGNAPGTGYGQGPGYGTRPGNDYAPADGYGHGSGTGYGRGPGYGHEPGNDYGPPGGSPPAYPRPGVEPPNSYYPPGQYLPGQYPPAYPPGTPPGYYPPGNPFLEEPPLVAPPNDPVFGNSDPRTVRPAPGPLPPPPAGPFIPARRPRLIKEYCWTYIEPPAARAIMLHDIVTILVDEKAELLVQSRYNRQRNLSYKAQLKEFLRINDDFNLDTAAPNSPSIDATLQGRMQSDGQVTDREGIRYRIAASVVGVLPNGNVVLEARKVIQSNDGEWEYTLTGTIASRDIRNDYTAISENVANLQIEKKQTGRVADSAQRTWGMWLYDKLSPF